MKTFEEIKTTIYNLNENLYERLTEYEYDAFYGDKNAQVKFHRTLKKVGLTEEEWKLYQQWILI